jgi:hypothetical protein
MMPIGLNLNTFPPSCLSLRTEARLRMSGALHPRYDVLHRNRGISQNDISLHTFGLFHSPHYGLYNVLPAGSPSPISRDT